MAHHEQQVLSDNPLLRVRQLGQSIWLDFIRRGMNADGQITSLIRCDGLAGITSNPVIFEHAIGHTQDYDTAIAALRSRGAGVDEMYENLVLDDIAQAANLFLPMLEATEGRDGFVSHEVSPHLAHDTDATIAEARRWWARLAHPNVLIKVPGTAEGIPAIAELIAEGINVNVTLLFSIERYEQVADAYMAGLERRTAHRLPLSSVASVASFFLSRIDHLVDQRLDGLGTVQARALRGRIAEALAKLAYQVYRRLIATDRWRCLADQGARPQRLLWASMSPKNPSYPDVKYVNALIGPDTVATLPLQTLTAFRDHGDPACRLEDDLDAARAMPEALQALGIDLAKVSAQLEEEGIDKFIKPFDSLHETLAQKMMG